MPTETSPQPQAEKAALAAANAPQVQLFRCPKIKTLRFNIYDHEHRLHRFGLFPNVEAAKISAAQNGYTITNLNDFE